MKKQTNSPRKQTNSPRKQTNSPRKQTNSPRKQTNSPRKQTNSPRKQTNSPRKQPNSPRKQTNSPRKQPNSPRKQTNSPRVPITPSKNAYKHRKINEIYKEIYDEYVSNGKKIYLDDIKLNNVLTGKDLIKKLSEHKNNYFKLKSYNSKVLIFNYKEDVVMFKIKDGYNKEQDELQFVLINKDFTEKNSCIISSIKNIKDKVYKNFQKNIEFIKNGITIPCIGKYEIESNFKKIINKYKNGIYCGYENSYIKSSKKCTGPEDKKGTWIVNLKRDLFQALGCKYIMLIDASKYDSFSIFHKNLMSGISPFSWYEKFGYEHHYNTMDIFNIVKKINIYHLLIERFDINPLKDDEIYTLEDYLKDIYKFGKITDINYINSFLEMITNYHIDNKNSYIINYLYYINKNGLMHDNIYDDLRLLKYDVKKLILQLKDDDIKYDYIISLISVVFMYIGYNKRYLIYDCEK